MGKLFIALLLLGVGVYLGASYHSHVERTKQQTVSTTQTAKKKGMMYFRVIRTGVEAGMDQAAKEKQQ